MHTTLSSRGQLVLPAEIRREDGLRAGQQFEIERIERGEYRLALRSPQASEGLLDWLLKCPEKGYFVPADSTNAAMNSPASGGVRFQCSGVRIRT